MPFSSGIELTLNPRKKEVSHEPKSTFTQTTNHHCFIYNNLGAGNLKRDNKQTCLNASRQLKAPYKWLHSIGNSNQLSICCTSVCVEEHIWLQGPLEKILFLLLRRLQIPLADMKTQRCGT